MKHKKVVPNSGQVSVGRRGTVAISLALVTGLSACAAPKPGQQFNDPYEKTNRSVHEFNVALDKHVIRPVAIGYGTVVPAPVRTGISNFSANLSQPSYIVNDLLQAKLGDATANTLRFVTNTIFGIGGIFDPAGAMGLTARPNDFGHTLYTWGAREGAYLDIPVLGPSTERDFAGTVVDFFTDPMQFAVPSDKRYIIWTADAGKKLNYRYKYKGTVDSLLYGSADSYGQLRLYYLENRRYQLGESTASNTYNPYEDSNGK